MIQPNKIEPMSHREVAKLPNGATLYCAKNEAGGRTYYSDEIGGGGTLVWDTCLCASSTLLAAILEEERAQRQQMHAKQSTVTPDEFYDRY